MYFPRNWEFGSALSKLQNFGEGGFEPPTPPPLGTSVVISRSLSLRMEARPPIWRVAANILNKQCRTADNINTDNSSFEKVELFQYLGTFLRNQNSIQEEIKSRLRSGNACHHSVQNLLSSDLLPKI
jgi:hypothetical protein